MDKFKKSKYFKPAIVASCVALGLIIVVLVVFLVRRDVVSICSECDYGGKADFCRCVKREEVKIIPGSENDYKCANGGRPVYDEVGGIVGEYFVGCAAE